MKYSLKVTVNPISQNSRHSSAAHFDSKLSLCQVQRNQKYAILKVASILLVLLYVYKAKRSMDEGSWHIFLYFLKEINHSFRLKIPSAKPNCNVRLHLYTWVQVWVYLCTYTPLHLLDHSANSSALLLSCQGQMSGQHRGGRQIRMVERLDKSGYCISIDW